MGFKGDLDTFGLATIFQNLSANQQSGTLHVFDDNSERFLVFSEGTIRSVSSGERCGVSLGEILVARGKIDENALATALSEQRKTKGLLGDVLVQMNACSQADIDEALRFQMEEEVFDLFIWRGARFEFSEDPAAAPAMVGTSRVSQVEINTSSLIFEAMRRIDEWSRLSQLIPSFEMVPVIPEERQTEELFASLSAEEKRILTYVDGVNNLHAITRKSSMGRYAVTQLLARLIEAGEAREATLEEMRDVGERLVLHGDANAAVALYHRIVSLAPDDAAARSNLATALENSGEDKDAAEHYGHLAEVLCDRDDITGAINAAEKAAALIPADLDMLERLANLNTLANHDKEAGTAWIKLIRRLEETGDRKRALAKVKMALADLSDNDDIRRMHARLLLEVGDTQEAAKAYEMLAATLQKRGDHAAAITAYRSVLRIDGSRADVKKRIDRLQAHKTEKKQQRLAFKVSVAAGVVAAALVILAGLNEVTASKSIHKALDEARKLEAQAKEAHPIARVEQLGRALAALEKGRPAFTLLGPVSKLEEKLESLKQLYEETEAEVERLHRRQKELIQRWQDLQDSHSQEARQALQALRALAKEPAETAEVKEARAILAKLKRQYKKEKGAVKKLLDAIANKNLAAPKRLDAYQELAKKFPAALKRKYPDGLHGLTLPVQVSAVSETGTALVARILIDKSPWPKKTPCVVELPFDPSVPVVLHCRGFGDRNARTPLSRAATLQATYKQVLKRSARWTLKLKGGMEGSPAISPDGRTLYVATTAGDIRAVEVARGKVRWPRRSNQTAARGGVFKVPLQLLRDRLIALGQNGFMLALSPVQGEVLWPKNQEEGPLQNQQCLDFTVIHLRSVGRKPRGIGLAVTCSTNSPLFMLDAEKGGLLWPKTALARKQLWDKIGKPVGRSHHLRKHGRLLLLGANGILHLLLTDGTYLGQTETVKERVVGQPLFFEKNDGKTGLVVAFEGKGIYCFEIASAGTLAAKLLWQQKKLSNQSLLVPFLMSGGRVFAGLSSGRVVGLSLRDGAWTSAWDYRRLPGPVAGQMAIVGDRLLVPCVGRNERPGALVGLRLTAKGITGEAWRYQVGRVTTMSGVTVGRDPEGGGIIVYGADKTLYCLDTEK